MRRLALACLLLLTAPAAIADDCAVPAELLQDDPRLPRTRERLERGEGLRIVVIGGSSTAGTAVDSPDKSYPMRLQAALRQRSPKNAIDVVNKGVPRQTAQQMLERFDRDVFPERPNLVIWETGTTDAVRGVEIEDFARTMETGLDRLKERGLEAVVMNMQYSRGTATVIPFDRYLEALRRAADVADVVLFNRYDVMRYWSEAGIFNFEEVPQGERAAFAARVYDCIARRLADALAFAMQP